MLHHAKVLQALEQIQEDLFYDNSEQIALARASWQRIVKDPLFAHKVHEISSPWLLPVWKEPLAQVHAVDGLRDPYQVISVDGSQIYPDRHQGTSCYLINIGSVRFSYAQKSEVQFDSAPYLFAGRTQEELEESAIDVVNAKRQELELQAGLELCEQFRKEGEHLAFLFDGSLIFWHLASGQSALKDYYLSRYLGLMHTMYQQRLLHGGYISLPKSKELVNLIRIELCNFLLEGCTEHKAVDHIVDSTVAGFFLQPGQRTIVFRSNAVICKLYPELLVPHFFYMHVGDEIARVEIPAWIAHDQEKTDLLARIMYDQAQKGGGYPVVIAEAHEQAVVKGPDREFFYHMLRNCAVQKKQQQIISQKSAKKRIIGI